MMLSLENLKLALGHPSKKLASFFVDERLSPWQDRRLRPFLEKDPEFRRDWSDFSKIKLLLADLSGFEFSPDFDTRFAERLSLEKESRLETKRAWTWQLPRLEIPVLRPALALASLGLVIAVSTSYLLLASREQPMLYQVAGATEYRSAPEESWKQVTKPLALRRGVEVRTRGEGSADVVLGKRFVFRMQDKASVKFETILKGRDRGEFLIQQNSGKVLIFLTPEFKGSSFTIKALATEIRAFGTRFLVSLEAPNITRVGAIEGEVHIRHLIQKPDRYEKIVLPLDSEIRLRPTTPIPPPEPLEKASAFEIESLKALIIPGQKASTQKEAERRALESPFVKVLMIRSPERVAEFLDNPRVSILRGPGRIQETVSAARELTAQAYQTDNLEFHRKAIRMIETMLDRYLDPYGHFEPQLRLFLAAYDQKLGNLDEGLDELEKLLKSPYAAWKAQALTAKAILFEKKGNREKSSSLYEEVLSQYPESLEARFAASRLKKK